MKTKLKLLPDDVLEEAAECLKVMAHPVRLKIVNVLIQGRFPVHEISTLAGISPNQTCGHLRLLHAHGLLVQRKTRTHGVLPNRFVAPARVDPMHRQYVRPMTGDTDG